MKLFRHRISRSAILLFFNMVLVLVSALLVLPCRLIRAHGSCAALEVQPGKPTGREPGIHHRR